MNTKRLTRMAIVTSTYVVLTLVSPLSYGLFNIRLSNLLIPLGFDNKTLRKGITLGVAISNLSSTLGIMDVFFGTIAATTGYILSDKADNTVTKSLYYSMMVSVFVALELKIAMKLPYLISFVSILISNFTIVLLGSIVSNNLIRRGC